MDNINYKKYYDLENYVFNEVRKNFLKRKYLTAQEFFCIIIWKANRAKTKIKKKLSITNSISKNVKKITEQIFKANNANDKLDILLKKWNFGMPMATAILSALYPDKFTVYDYRVREQLKLKNIYSSKGYFSYFLPKIQAEARKNGVSLRETDKELWGKSFFEDLEKMLKE